MPTTMLTDTRPAHVPARPLTLIAEREGPGPGVDLAVTPELAVVRRPRPGMLIVPFVDQPMTVSVRPTGGGVFDPATVIHLSVVVSDASTTDPERVIVPAATVSRLPSVAVLLLEPDSTGVSLRLPVARPADLSELGEAALLAGQAALGVDRAAGSERVGVRVVVDASVSMITAIEDGSLRAAIDVLAGVSALIGEHALQEVVVGAAVPQTVRAQPDRIAAATEQAMKELALSTGFVTSEAVPAAAPNTITYIVTDCIPADQEHLANSGARFHAAVIAPADSAAALTAMSRVPLTVLGISPGSPPTAADPDLERAVRGLLAEFAVSSSYGSAGLR